jgi:lysyl-tRNA synthetase class 2
MNENVRQKFVTKAKIIKYLRRFLDDLGFLEVLTNSNLFLRIFIYF